MAKIILFPLFYLFISSIFLISVIGYGGILNYFLIKNNYSENYKNLDFIFGLIIIGLLSSLLNIFFPIYQNFSVIIILCGLFCYFYKLYYKKNYKSELIFIIIIILLSFSFSFYAGIHDDYGYHFDTIKNFKDKNIFEIIHHRQISYNSHWLIINSVFFVDSFTPTLFMLTSLLFSICIYDFYINYRYNLENKSLFLFFYIVFLLVFFLGVMNNYKDFGTDFPGAIICFYISILYIDIIENKKKISNHKSFIILLFLCNFAFMIKITNALIYFFIFILFFSLNNKIKLLLKTIILSFPIYLWFFQNINISECLIWPISFLCYGDTGLATHELYLIESFAKGDINTSIEVDGFGWISTWVNNHSKKLLETYVTYTILLIIPILFYKLKYKLIFISFNQFIINILLSDKFLKIYFPICVLNILWFVYIPAYRFGIYYNLTLILFFIIPFWIKIYEFNKKTTFICLNVIILISIIFYIINNIMKIRWYLDRYESLWPPIINNNLIVI